MGCGHARPLRYLSCRRRSLANSCRNQRLQLRTLEGELLPGEDAGGAHVGRSTPSDSPRSRSTTPSTGCRRRRRCASGRPRRPQTFRFVLKSPRRITHDKRLVGVGDDAGVAVQVGRRARRQAGAGAVPAAAVRAQGRRRARRLPGRDCPPARGAALEFRHESWFSSDVYAVLARARRRAVHRRVRGPGDAAGGDGAVGLPAAAASGLCRGRRRRLGRSESGAQGWSEAYVFFKHEDEGKGPKLAAQLIAALGS